MTALETTRIVKRVISEVARTISTNGIQELSREELGGDQFGYVYSCLIATAYNACRALPHFNHTYTEFWNAVETETLPLMEESKDAAQV